MKIYFFKKQNKNVNYHLAPFFILLLIVIRQIGLTLFNSVVILANLFNSK